MEKASSKLLTVEEIQENSGADEYLFKFNELNEEIKKLNESAALSREKNRQAEETINQLSRGIADALICNRTADELVQQRSLLKEQLNDLAAIPGRIEQKVRELERQAKQIESEIFKKFSAVLRDERRKRIDELGIVITSHCAEWLDVTSKLSKSIGKGAIPPGWPNLRAEILLILESVYGSSGSNFRG